MNVYDIKWFLYVAISFLAIIGLNVLLHYTVKKESTKETIIKIMAIITLFSHISIYYYNYIILRDPNNNPGDSTFFPIYPCNVAMMLYPAVYLFTGKARKFLLTFLAYYGVLGGIITMFEPSSFYQGGNIFEWGTFKSFLSHSLLLLTSVYSFVSGEVKIGIKNVIPFMGGLIFIFLPVGLIINTVLVNAGYDVNGMYLRHLPLPGVPLLNPWVISLLMVIVVIIFITIWDRFTKTDDKRWYHQI